MHLIYFMQIHIHIRNSHSQSYLLYSFSNLKSSLERNYDAFCILTVTDMTKDFIT